MKTIFISMTVTFLTLSAIFCGPAHSQTFLVCDAPPASEQVIKYTGTVDGQSFQTPFSLHPAGKAIIYDMKDLIDSTQHVFSDIRACNALGCSDPAISFVSPPRPAAPEGLSFIN